jgi:hypothetical protein
LVGGEKELIWKVAPVKVSVGRRCCTAAAIWEADRGAAVVGGVVVDGMVVVGGAVFEVVLDGGVAVVGEDTLWLVLAHAATAELNTNPATRTARRVPHFAARRSSRLVIVVPPLHLR